MRYSALRYSLPLSLSVLSSSLPFPRRPSAEEKEERERGVISSFSLLSFSSRCAFVTSVLRVTLRNPSLAFTLPRSFSIPHSRNKSTRDNNQRERARLISSVCFSVSRKAIITGGSPSRTNSSRRTPPLPYSSVWKTDRNDTVSVCLRLLQEKQD